MYRKIINTFITKSNRYLSTYTGGEIVYNKLLENNVKDAFIYSGGAIMPLIDCFYKNKIKYYVNTHEQNTGHAELDMQNPVIKLVLQLSHPDQV